MRAVSLSQEPAFSTLKNSLVCGYKDISNESFAGFSGKHEVGGNAINTSNGAGPTNLQTFLLSSDGTVLSCLPGFWNPIDLVSEIEFANRLNNVWTSPKLTRTQKDNYFKQMHLAHINEHSFAMVKRSRMQNFDMAHEAKNNLYTSDTILDRGAASAILTDDRHLKRGAMQAFKTTDRIMHERMAQRPFVSYTNFDTMRFAKYGRPLYDKNEDFRTANGKFLDNGREVDMAPDSVKDKPLIGKIPDQVLRRRAKRQQRNETYDNRLWGQTEQYRPEQRQWGQSMN